MALGVSHVQGEPAAVVGDRQYDVLSALHKSLRGGDPDAATYWVQRLLVAGEDPLVVARRLVRMASEDVGLADPRALGMALDALRAAQFLGLPEGDAALCQAAIYLALAPKSDAVYRASGEAKQAAEQGGALDVPPELAGSRRKGARPYQNPHELDGRVTSQQHLPDKLADAEFYRPGELGFEAHLRERLETFRRRRRKGRAENPGDGQGGGATGAAAP